MTSWRSAVRAVFIRRNWFVYAPGFFPRLRSAVELGRSFIVPDHQKDYEPLLLLWQAIARCVARQPDAPILFGAMSISSSYTETSREMMVSVPSRA